MQLVRGRRRSGVDREQSPGGLPGGEAGSVSPSPSRLLGQSTSAVTERRGEILATAYAIATAGAIAAWAVAPKEILNALGMGLPVAMAGVAAIAFHLFRRRLPPYAEDVGVLASLGLVGLGIAFVAQPALFTPYFVWVGFSAPMWFPRRRALLYLALTAMTCGADMLLAGTAAAMASWVVTTTILVVAFLLVQFLSNSLVAKERLATMGELASAVGHEMRNPLTSIGNALYLIRSEIGSASTPRLEQYLALGEREAARAGSIAEDLLSLARPRTSEVAPFEISSALHSALASAPPPAGVHVEEDIEPTVVLADRDQVAQILGNLLANAYQAMASGGTLRLATATERATVAVTVSDTGAGMDQRSQERMFEPFFTTRPGGTGLGLAIVRRLVDDNGGRVEVESAVGSGTHITIRLPKAPAAASRRSSSPALSHIGGAAP